MIIKIINLSITSFLVFLIKIYQIVLSPFLKSHCRFLPTCSEYTISALKEHGIIIGMYYSFKRIISCHPFGKHGYDPIPKKSTKEL